MTTQQEKAYQKFNKLKVGALFMEQGTGKTRVAIELAHSTNSDYVLFLCPFSTKDNLITEIKKWQLNIEYEIMAYETLQASDKQYVELLERIRENKNLFIIADESIFIKNDETKRFKRVMKLSEYSEYRLILNGTPVTKNEWDIYNQMEFLSNKIIGMNRNQFLNTFFTKVQYKKKFQHPREFYKLSKVNVDYLHKLIEPYVFRVDMDFDKQIKKKYKVIPASDDTIEIYLNLKDTLLDKIAKQEDFLDVLTKMQYETFTDKERCKKISEQLGGQVIVYCSYLKEIRYISSKLNCYVITGETSSEERINTLEAFKNNKKPLLMTYGVGSCGLNLQFCSHIVFASLMFDYAKIEHAQARIKRLGQKNDITYTYFTSNLGIYDLIEQNISNKTNLSELMVQKVKEVFINEKISRKECS